jgi:hypothetical protein
MSIGVYPQGLTLALVCPRTYACNMSGPSSHPKRKDPVFVPHPDDLEAVREAFDESRKDDLLSAEESMAYLRWLETGEAPDDLKAFFETGER